MECNKVLDEMCFITSTLTDDLGYLLYLMLKGGIEVIEKKEVIKEIEDIDSFDDWFDSL